jgi:hypothetical protein
MSITTEQRIDAEVQKLLSIDSAYKNAKNAEEQAKREEEIVELVEDEVRESQSWNDI